MKPTRKTVRAAIRGSVPKGNLARAKIVLSDAPPGAQQIGGFTEYARERGGEVAKLGAPAGDKSWDITVRGHETRHASKHRPPRKKLMTENEALAGQIVDDVNVESLPLPNVRDIRPYQRAHLTTAMMDLRTILKHNRAMKAGVEPNIAATRNAQLVHSIRVAAMLKHYGSGGYGEQSVRMRGLKKLRDINGNATMRAIQTVIQLAKSRRNRARAISVLTALMESEETPEEIEEREKEQGRSEILAPVVHGDAEDGKMLIRDLRPKAVYCAKEKQITRKHAPDGVAINPSRYVNAIVSGESHGLFQRRVRQKPGGTVVIDASGSMSVNGKNLAALLALIPTATVAYYSGTGSGRGELVVYAKEGKRFAGKLPEETIHGGNAVDLPAVQWMMKHSKPWTFVSDLQFCGGVLGSEVIAKALLERAKMRGDVTIHGSLDAAYMAFGGKESDWEKANRYE